MKAATSSSSASAIAEALATSRTWPRTPPLKAAMSLSMRSIVKSTVRACSSERHAGRRGLHAAAAAHQDRRAERGLELRDALADGRRLDMLLHRGALDVLQVAYRHQQAQRLDVDIAHGGLPDPVARKAPEIPRMESESWQYTTCDPDANL